jgi:hypothetical protein
MARYAIINNEKVSNIVESESSLASSRGWIEAPGNVGIGDLYVNGSFVKVLTSEDSKKVSPIQFKLLFTFAEAVAIRSAISTDQILEEFYKIIDDPRLTEVDLSLSAVSSGIDYLIAKGLIAPERKQEILNGELK